MPTSFTIHHPSEMLSVAQAILEAFPKHRVFALSGDLGAGKTTFTKAFASVLGINEAVSSPTFSIVHEYGNEANKLFHFDLYRVKDEAELYGIGFEEYLEQRAYVLIEWPEMAKNFLPTSYVSVVLEAEDENTRQIICRIVD